MDIGDLKGTIRAAARGDRVAAGALFDTYYPRIYRYALARIGSSTDAEDVAAETFARVLRDLGRFQWRGGGFEAWIFKIAGNLVMDHFRKVTREQPTDTSAALASTATLAADTDAIVEGALMGEQVAASLVDLPEDQREVLTLRFAAGLDTSETAAVMGRNANAIRQLQFRALSALRDKVRDGRLKIIG